MKTCFMAANTILRVENIIKTFQTGDVCVHAVNDISLELIE